MDQPPRASGASVYKPRWGLTVQRLLQADYEPSPQIELLTSRSRVLNQRVSSRNSVMELLIPSANPQNDSPFFRLPLEIRRIIYSCLDEPTGMHITRDSQVGFMISPCLDPEIWGELSGKERQPRVPNGGVMTNTVWRDRVASTWGPHWRCEEVILRKREGLAADEVAKAESWEQKWCAQFDRLLICKRT